MKIEVKGISHKRKIIVVHEPQKGEDGSYKCCWMNPDTLKIEVFKMSEEEFLEARKKPISSKYMLIQYDRRDHNVNNLKDFYKLIIDNAKKLQKATSKDDVKICMWKTGKYSKTALAYLADLLSNEDNLQNIDIEPIEDYEARFFMDCGAGFRLAKPYNGPLYKYDVRSFYPSVYSSVHLLIPIKKGILQTITQKDFDNMEYIKFGIYRAEVKKPDDPDLAKLVWISKSNYYTHYELSYYRIKGIKIKIIEEPNNFLHYPRNYCLTGSQIFGKFAKNLYKMKEVDGINAAKKLLNNIWGILTKKNKEVTIVEVKDNASDEDLIAWDDYDEVIPIGNGKFKLTRLRDKKFEYDLARMKPFFLAKCRLTMVKLVEPIIKDVYYSHTDSILCSKPLNIKDEGKWVIYDMKVFVKMALLKIIIVEVQTKIS